MAQPVVVVAFYSRGGETERLATAAAVGAVQARAGIRMRRIAEADLERTRQLYPSCREHVDRMLREYVAPKEADVLAADGLVIGSPPDLGPASAEWTPFFAMLEGLRAAGKLSGKAAAAVGPGPSCMAFAAALNALGFTVVSPTTAGAADVDASVSLGRALVAAAAKAHPAATTAGD